MKILLIRPKPHRYSIGLQSFMICEPLELEQLASVLEQQGHEVIVLDMMLEKRALGYFLGLYQPQLVGLTAYITHVGVVKNYAKEVKQVDQSIVTVVGGIHAEVVPLDFQSPYIDHIIHVNGIETMIELAQALEKNNKNIDKIPGIWTGPNREYKLKRTFDYPFPDRSKTRKYRKDYNYIFHSHCAILKTSFGCPYSCEFCFCVEITRHHYFERPLKTVIEEIKTIKERNIFIVDDTFLCYKKRVLEFCDLLEKYAIKKNFILFGRSDFIAENEDVILRFKSLGLQAVFIGLESFTQGELNSLNKKTLVETNVRALRILEKHNVECHGGILVHPDWKKKDFDNMVRWVNKFKKVFINIQPLTPLPGTPIFEKYRNRLISPYGHHEKWDMAHIMVHPKHMSIRQFYGQIIKAYYRTTSSIHSHLYILRNYGLKTYLRTAWGSLYLTAQYIMMFLRGR